MAESGTHEQLVDRAGLYAELWSAQETLFSDDKVLVEEDAKEPTQFK